MQFMLVSRWLNRNQQISTHTKLENQSLAVHTHIYIHIFYSRKNRAYASLYIDAHTHHFCTRGSSAASLGSRGVEAICIAMNATNFPLALRTSPNPLFPRPRKPPSCFNPWRGTAGRNHRFSTGFRSRYHEAYFWCMKKWFVKKNVEKWFTVLIKLYWKLN